jgi:acetylornithine deacetylase/succinyl-diaminopimelate desuccinylase-like protein
MHQSAPDIASVLDYADQHLNDSLEALFALMRVQSISTDPAYKGECRKAAELLSAELNDLGFKARVADTAGHPMVVAHHDGPAPHVLFYGHYDVQPVDPLNLWRRDPFDAQLETRPDGSKLIYGRGASDDKGQLRTFIEACRAWKATTGALPCRVTLLLEGEEESGSTNFAPFLKANAEELKADFALVCDTSMWDAKTPAVTIGLRGNATGEVYIKAAARDLHSGLYGGPARNPIHVLTDVLASLHDDTGRVTLEGFYDGVPELTDAVKTAWKALNFDGAAFLDEVGLHVPAGEQGYSILEQMWARPTAEVNGISGGYTGAGFKTVIASEAFAKISFRLVGQQDPDKVWAAFEQHVRNRLPADCSVVFKKNPGSRAITLADNTPALVATRGALSEEWGVETALMASGGSIPIINSIKRELNMDSVMVGFALNDDQIHSPNEKYELQSFHKGIRSWVRILPALAAMATAGGQAQAAE